MRKIITVLTILSGFCGLTGCSSSPTTPGGTSGAWQEATANAFSAGRYGLAGTVFNNAMWAVGGASGSGTTQFYGDVYSSGSGSSWTQTKGDNDNYFGKRYGAQLLSFNGKLWLIGGNNKGTFKNDVWNSSDGSTWTQVTITSLNMFSAREDFSAVVMNGAIYVIGGWDGGPQNDVWNSTDGANWNQILPSGPSSATQFGARWGFPSVVYNNSIWIFGGAKNGPTPSAPLFDDVWSSPDGMNWTLVSSTGDPLYYHQMVVYNNQMVFSGGDCLPCEISPQYWVYGTSDWTHYTQITNLPTARFGHLSLSYNNEIWVIGGCNNYNGLVYYNDVWHLP